MAKVLNWVFFGRLFLTLHLKVDQKKCVRLLNSSLQPDQEYTKTKESFCKKWLIAKKETCCKNIFAERTEHVSGCQEVVLRDDGGGRQDARLQLQILLSQVQLVCCPSKWTTIVIHCSSLGGLLTASRKGRSSEKTKIFTSGNNIWKWRLNMVIYTSPSTWIMNLRSLASAQISLDMLKRQASIGEFYNPRYMNHQNRLYHIVNISFFAGWPFPMRRRSHRLEL